MNSRESIYLGIGTITVTECSGVIVRGGDFDVATF